MGSGAPQILADSSLLGGPKGLKSPWRGDEERRDPLLITGEQRLFHLIQVTLPMKKQDGHYGQTEAGATEERDELERFVKNALELDEVIFNFYILI